jgi:hypothetical protein
MFATQRPKMKSRLLAAIACAVTLGSFIACEAPRITDITRSRIVTASDNGNSFDKLIKCPTDESASNTAVVTPLDGGTISAGGVTAIVPPGAVLLPQTVTVTVPPSKFMYAEIKVEGIDHFQFETPITVVMSYARCNDPSLNLTQLTAWYVSLEDEELLEQMPSVQDNVTQTVTFTTIHLSGYALAD